MRQISADSKYLGEIFSELLRQRQKIATKLAQGAKSCRFLKMARRHIGFLKQNILMPLIVK